MKGNTLHLYVDVKGIKQEIFISVFKVLHLSLM